MVQGRAFQLHRAGFRRLEDVARAAPDDLVAAVTHLSRTAANHLISAARVRHEAIYYGGGEVTMETDLIWRGTLAVCSKFTLFIL